MKYLGLAILLTLVGCASDPVLYDGARHVVVYCEDKAEHIRYLETEISRSKDPEFISHSKRMLWDIKFSCQ